MTLVAIRALLTDHVRQVLTELAAGPPECYTLDAVIEAGVPVKLAALLIADPATASFKVVPARMSVRKRGRIQTRAYIWTPDIANHLRGFDDARGALVSPHEPDPRD